MPTYKLLPCIALLTSSIICSTCCSEQIKKEYRLQKLNGLLFADVYLNGSKLRFLVDTGSPRNIICEKHKGKLSGIKRREAVTTASPIEFRVGPFPAHAKSRICVMDLSSLEESFGYQVDGVLGLPFFENRTLRFSPSESFIEFSSDEDHSREKDLLQLEISVGDFGMIYSTAESLGLPFKCECVFLIDSGSYEMLGVNSQTFSRILTLETCSLRGSMASSMIASESGNGLERKDSRAAVISSRGIARQFSVFETEDCVAGLPLLEALRVRIDFANSTAWKHPILDH